jgi:hypothetical protein
VKYNVVKIVIFITFITSCNYSKTKETTKQSYEYIDGDYRIKTQIFYYKSNWFGIVKYSNRISTKNIDSLGIYLQLELEKADKFNKDYKNLKTK